MANPRGHGSGHFSASRPTRRVLADDVYESILSAVVDGQLQPGAAVSIDGVARELGVSPTPVREALARLEATRMVHRVALKGYRVAPLLSAAELSSLMDARLVIEPVNAYQACRRNTPALYGELRQAAENLAQAPHHGPFESFRNYWIADERFHLLITEACGNPFMIAAYSALGGQIQIPRLRLHAAHDVSDADQTVEEHFAILQAFAEADSARAGEAMGHHLEGVKARALHHLQLAGLP
jgi:DNA-binding GntR family transcriptional regulator